MDAHETLGKWIGALTLGYSRNCAADFFMQALKAHAWHAGMMCIISASREMGLDTSDLPLHIFGPAGLAEYLRCCLIRTSHWLVNLRDRITAVLSPPCHV